MTVTPAADFYNPGICDCSQEPPDSTNGFQLDTSTAIFVDNGIVFTRRVCINLMHRDSVSGWVGDCLASDGSNDTGDKQKYVRVRVSFYFGASTHTVDAESLVSR